MLKPVELLLKDFNVDGALAVGQVDVVKKHFAEQLIDVNHAEIVFLPVVANRFGRVDREQREGVQKRQSFPAVEDRDAVVGHNPVVVVFAVYSQ